MYRALIAAFTFLLSTVLNASVLGQFQTTYLHDKKEETYVVEAFRGYMSWDEDFQVSSKIKSISNEIVISGTKVILTHHFVVGDGFSKNPNESLQLISVRLGGTNIILFNTGAYMPECGAADWKFDDISIKIESSILFLFVDRYIHGCLGETATITNYRAQYDLDKKELLKLQFKGESL